LWILTVPLSPGTAVGDLALPTAGAAPAPGPVNANVKTEATSVAPMTAVSLAGQVIVVMKKPLVLEDHGDTKEAPRVRQPLHRPGRPLVDGR